MNVALCGFLQQFRIFIEVDISRLEHQSPAIPVVCAHSGGADGSTEDTAAGDAGPSASQPEEMM